MSNPKRRHRGNDRTQAFLRQQQEQRDADFAAIEARYRKEVYTLKDGSTAQIISDNRDTHRDLAQMPPKAIAHKKGLETPDSLLELALSHQEHVVFDQEQRDADDAEMKQALRDKGVTFSREPKSIYSPVPSGRIGSIPRPTAPPKKPDGNGGAVKLWPGNHSKRLNPYIHRFNGSGDL